MEIMKLTIKEDFHRMTVFFLFSYQKITLFEKKYDIKVVYSCWISSAEWSDVFRSFFVYGKKQESIKKIYHNRAKKFHLPEEV